MMSRPKPIAAATMRRTSCITGRCSTAKAPGNRTSKTTPLGTETYRYDALDRLTQVGTSPTPTLQTSNQPGAPALPLLSMSSTSYSFDAAGNRLSKSSAVNGITAETDSYSYDAADQLT